MLSFKSFLLEASLEKNHLVLGNKYRNRIISAIENDDLQLAKSPNTKIVVINKEDLIQRIKDAKTKDQLSAIFNRDTYPFETKEHGKLKLKDIDKSPFSGYGGSGGKISGADWEKVICVAWNQYIMKQDEEKAKSDAGITEWKPHFSDEVSESGIIITDIMLKNGASKFKNKPMLHYGAGSVSVSATWKKHYDDMRSHIKGWKASDQPASASRTPKTDMRFENGHKISAKKSGGSQLMSGGDFETVGTIAVAMAKIREHSDFSKELETKLKRHESDILKEVRPKVDKTGAKTGKGFITKGFTDIWQTMSGASGAQTQMKIDPKAKRGERASLKKGVKDSDGFLKWMVETTNMQDRVQQSLESIINEGDIGFLFQKAMVHEAMTGQVKFGEDSDASADWILKWTESGEGTEYHAIGSADSDYVEYVTKKTGFNVSFKTSGAGKSAWSALKMIFGESFEELGGQYLSEQDMLDEGVIWNFIKKWISRAWKKIVSLVRKSLSKLMEIFGLTLQVDLRKNYTF
tara:strand:- start:3437 stop:4993 length:1557 start_codon:yes stop_codon:yes gene_type:complete